MNSDIFGASSLFAVEGALSSNRQTVFGIKNPARAQLNKTNIVTSDAVNETSSVPIKRAIGKDIALKTSAVNRQNGNTGNASANDLFLPNIFVTSPTVRKIIAKLPMHKPKSVANDKAKGAKIGRPKTTKDDIPPLFYKHYPMYKKGDLNITDLSRLCEVSRKTIYKYLSLLK